MKKTLALLTLTLFAIGCSSTPAPQAMAPAVLDYGDYSSQTLTTNAWNALGAGQYDHVIAYTDKCIELYEKEARVMQASLNARAPADKVYDYWALNDVGTSYFIKGEALAKMGKKAEAVAAFTVVRDELHYAQTWDPKGWFWAPATASYTRIQVLNTDF